MIRSDNGRSGIVKHREYTGNGHIIVDDSLKMTRFPGGYFTPDGGGYLARDYVASFPRFNAIDPMAASSAAYSPYLYSNGDPVNNIDPNGRSTQVKQTGANTYEVIGGALDGDLNVYQYTQDKNGNFTVKGNSIGTSVTETSFYDSDKNAWNKGSVIDLSDTSGQEFLSRMMTDTPFLDDYAINAKNAHPYDFKSTNGTATKKYDRDQYHRGMPISLSEDGPSQIASARDVGNIAAGYVVASNGLPYKVARVFFDAYQRLQSGDAMEGVTSTSAQRLGYNLGIQNTNSFSRTLRLVRTPHHFIFGF